MSGTERGSLCYTGTMTQQEAIAHWRKRAHAELDAARLLFEKGTINLCGAVLFHCHLALELALKAEYIRTHDDAAPFSHDINELANAVREGWHKQEKIAFEQLTEFAVLARYGDEEWYDKNATREKAGAWLKRTEVFLSTILQP